MAKLEELRKVKDQAAKAIEKRQYDKAAALYLEIVERDPDPDWLQRAGEALRRSSEPARAVDVLARAANGYANGGFLLKAIAVSKSLLQLDPMHTATQAMLVELYARRDGARPTPAPRASVIHPSAKAAPPPIAAQAAPPPSPSPRVVAVPLVAVSTILDEQRATVAAPIDVLPLRRVLGGRRSEQIAVADVIALASAEDSSPGVYEIELEDEEIIIEPTPPTAVEPSRPPVELASDDDDEPVIEVIRPTVQPPPTAVADETDFGDVMADAPAPTPPAPIVQARPTPAALPMIPLFSSLAEDDLRTMIERMVLRELDAGETVVRQGDAGGSLFVVVEGEVRVMASEGGQARELARLADGAFFGELGLLTDDPRSATVEVTRATRLLEIPRELAWDIVRRSAGVLRTLLRFLRDRMLDRLLGSSPLFSSLSPDDARTLAGQFVFLELDPGVDVVRAGERSPGLFFLLCGEAEVVRDGARVATLAPGDIFGEISLLFRSPATASVRATRKCWALSLPQARFQEIMVTYPQVLAYVSELGAERQSVALL